MTFGRLLFFSCPVSSVPESVTEFPFRIGRQKTILVNSTIQKRVKICDVRTILHSGYIVMLPVSAAFVCEDGWTLSEEICLKVVETALSFADASIECSNLATGGILAAPKSEAILNAINNLNPNGDDVWVGLDDRCEL